MQQRVHGLRWFGLSVHACVLTACLGAVTASAQLVAGPNVGVPGPHVTIPQTSMSHPNFDGTVRFDWGDFTPNGANPVAYDGNAGPLEKWLTFDQDQDNDGDVDLDDFNQLIANPITLQENIGVSGTTAWTGWHERIDTPGWSWLPNPLVVGTAGPTNTVAVNTSTTMDITFDPYPPGDLLRIEKQFVFSASNPSSYVNDFFAGTLMVKIIEYPTVPEPASALLLLGLAAIRRRH